MKSLLPPLLSVISGYVDTAGFLPLQGLFTAHVTGNFVTLGAALVFGSQGVVAKLLALPVFCVIVALVRLLSVATEKIAHRHPAIQNAPQRIYLASAPPTTIMTGNTTQIMIDIVDSLRVLPVRALGAVLLRAETPPSAPAKPAQIPS